MKIIFILCLLQILVELFILGSIVLRNDSDTVHKVIGGIQIAIKLTTTYFLFELLRGGWLL